MSNSPVHIALIMFAIIKNETDNKSITVHYV